VIVLHRPSGHIVVVNADIIEAVEAVPEGVSAVTLTSGNVLEVAETPEAVRDAVIAFRRAILAGP
jgi:uncharacterized protein YlzI (FlbEa/FlbD family)